MLLIFGAGYTGTAVARAAAAAGIEARVVSRTPKPGQAAFDNPPIASASAILLTAAPYETGDPVLLRHARAITAAPKLRWIGYCSTTGVYGDRGGGTVDEATLPAPGTERTRRRVAAEEAWRRVAGVKPLDILRLAGIYGPGRSVFDDLRAGTARRIIKPDQKFSRIHVDDIAQGVLAAMAAPPAFGARVLNFADDEPAASAAVIEEAARLLGIEPPPPVPFETALASMSPMAASFWAENRTVQNTATKAALGLAWRYPTYREGLRGILVSRT
jgi:nucleoside-diphosphate-sugar epimerase